MNPTLQLSLQLLRIIDQEDSKVSLNSMKKLVTLVKDNICNLTKEEEELDCVNETLKENFLKEAMNDEMKQSVKNNMWELVPPLEACKPIGLKWVLKVKQDSNGWIINHKTRFFVHHFAQRYGIDFIDIDFKNHGWKIHLMYVNSAFLIDDIIEDIYLKQPEGYEV